MCRIALATLTLAALLPNVAAAQRAGTRPARTAPRADVSTSSDYLNDNSWRRLPPEERRKLSRQRTVLRYEPEGVGRPERLEKYIAAFREANVYDPRLTRFVVSAEPAGSGSSNTIVLRGEVTVDRLRSGVAEVLGLLGFKVAANEIEVLPTKELGTDVIAFSTTSAATMRREPRADAEQVNSVPPGGWVRFLRPGREADLAKASEKPESWFLAQTSEGYLGFVRAADFTGRTTKPRPANAMLVKPYEILLPAGGKKTLPAGTCLTRADGTTSAPGFMVNGLGLAIPASAPVRALSAEPSADDILAVLKPFMDKPYVWGGVTDDGIDCSGLTQFYYKTRGVFLPRDAVQQAAVGQIVAFGHDCVRDARPGDLVFFGNDQGRISHVALSLGGGRLIHSSRDRVKVQSYGDSEDEVSTNSLASRVLFARRVN